MRRREFIAGLAGAAAWPVVARAQQSDRMRRIGVLQGGNDTDDPRSQPNVAAFQQALQQLGWTDGRNVKIDYRGTAGDADKGRKHAAELVALAPDVIVAFSAVSLVPLLQATRTVPIVFVAVQDPVGAGYVDSLSRPGGNATGFALFDYSLSTKWLELLKEIAPGVKRVATFGIPQSVPGMRGPDFSGAAFGPITDLRSARPCKRRILTIVQEPSFQGHRHCRAIRESNHRSRP